MILRVSYIFVWGWLNYTHFRKKQLTKAPLKKYSVIPLNPGSWQDPYSVSAQSLWNKRIFHSLKQTMEDWSPQRWIWWKKRCSFFGCIPGTPRPTIYQCLFQSDDSISNWLFGIPGINFHETLRPFFVGIHKKSLLTDGALELSWCFCWYLYVLHSTETRRSAVRKKNKKQGMVKNHTRFNHWKAPKLEGPGIWYVWFIPSFLYFITCGPAWCNKMEQGRTVLTRP